MMRMFLVAVMALTVVAAKHPFLEHGLVPDVVDVAPPASVEVQSRKRVGAGGRRKEPPHSAGRVVRNG